MLLWGYCNVNLTLIWLILPFALSYGTRGPVCKQKELFFLPHYETPLGITLISYQKQKAFMSSEVQALRLTPSGLFIVKGNGEPGGAPRRA